ncbi:MAG TPA: TonB-dependent receptor [Gemmatimonadaceae bacterium]|nr:TonB-dependent receptor [Gemmatimonadaceae bacterium]
MRLTFPALLATIAIAPLAAQVPGELHGRVTDARTAAPIADAEIEVAGRAGALRTGTDGAFTARGLEPRDYTVHVRAVGYAPRRVDATVTNGRAAVLEIVLQPTVVTLGRVVVTAARDTQSVQAVSYDRATIERSGRRDLGELLQSTPGVVITQAGGAGAETHVSIRGSSASEVLVLVDGVPLNSSLTGTVDLSRISLESVERVTVLTGAQSARYGPRAMAGVIEIETRRATGEQSLLLRTGAWGEREIAGTASGTQPAGTQRLGGSITGDYRYVRGDFPFDLPAVRGGGSATRINSDVSAGQLLGSASLEDSLGTERVRASWEDLSRGLAGTIVQPSASGRESNMRVGGGADARRTLGPLTLTALADLSHERATFIDPTPPFGAAYDDTISATGLEASATATVGGAASSAMLGGELRTLDVAATSLAPGAPHFQRLLGAFASYHASHYLESSRLVVAADASARVDNSSLDDHTAFSPRIGASLSRGVVTLSASVGNGYSPPTLADQFFQEGVLVRANPALRPERTRADVEGRVSVHDVGAGPFVLAGSAAVFRANIDGMILWLPDFRYIWSPTNFDVHRSGFELAADGSWTAPHLELSGTLDHTEVTYTGPVLSGQVAYRPATTASITGAYAPRAGRLELTTRYVGERRTVPGSALNTLDPYWLTDARWSTPFTRGRLALDVSVGVENVFDRPAAMLVDYPFPGRTWTLSLRARHLPSI